MTLVNITLPLKCLHTKDHIAQKRLFWHKHPNTLHECVTSAHDYAKWISHLSLTSIFRELHHIIRFNLSLYTRSYHQRNSCFFFSCLLNFIFLIHILRDVNSQTKTKAYSSTLCIFLLSFLSLSLLFTVVSSLAGKMVKQGPRPLVICGPSGSGKSTLLKRLFKEFPHTFGFSVSHTTRKPRPGEEHGVHYHYVSVEEMQRMIEGNEFIETAVFSGNMYGTR